MLVVGLVICFGMKSKKSQKKNYEALAKDFASTHEWVSFEFTQTHHKDNAELWKSYYHLILRYDNDNPGVLCEYLSEDGERIRKSFWIDKGKYIEIDHDNLEIVQYTNKKLFWDDYHSYGFMEFISNTFFYLSYYLYPMQKELGVGLMNSLVSDVKNQDTVIIKKDSYISFHCTSHTMYSYDPKAGKRIPVYYEVECFVNPNTKVMDSVFAVLYPLEYENKKDYIRLSSLDYTNMQQYIDSVFELDNPKYKNYSHHDSEHPPLSRSYSTNKSMNDNLLHYPIEQINGDKTTIADKEGWLLIDFWSINCAPCVACLKEMGLEKDSLCHYMLENDGIEVLAINHCSDNVELIRDIAEKTNTSEIIYYAKGIGSVINIPALGYYYLISPDKQIVYETGNLGDYSKLLEAKENYERQFQKE